MKTKMIIVFSLVLACFFSVYAQEIEVNVTVNMEQLPFEYRNDVMSMETDIENYINNQKFLKEDWEGPKIPVELSIVLSGGSNKNYTAKLLVLSKRNLIGEDAGASINLRMLENNWGFQYAKNASFYYNPLRFDNFSSILDFYMLLVIGFDLDTYGELEGSKAFNAAYQIVQLGASNQVEGFSTYSRPGEFTKYNLLSEISDMRYEDFRKLIFSYYYDGLDNMIKDKEKGLKGLDDVIYYMAKFKKEKLSGPSVLMQLFFDTKAEELAATFKGYNNETLFEYLIYLDPGNTMLYQQSKQGR